MANENERKAPLSLGGKGKLELRNKVETDQVRQSFSHGRSKVVQVERRKKRHVAPGEGTKPEAQEAPAAPAKPAVEPKTPSRVKPQPQSGRVQPPRPETRAPKGGAGRNMGNDEKQRRLAALQSALQDQKRREEEEVRRKAEEAARRQAEEEERRQREAEDAKRKAEEAAARKAEEEKQAAAAQAEAEAPQAPAAETPAEPAPASQPEGDRKPIAGPRRVVMPKPAKRAAESEEDERPAARRGGGAPGGAPKAPPRKTAAPKGDGGKRRGKLTISAALSDDGGGQRGRSVAAMRRAQQKEKRKAQGFNQPTEKQAREVVIPETITVQELANRMAERAPNVIKALMKMGVMATINQPIDADTAELVVEEFGHEVKRVSEADVLEGLGGSEDKPEDMVSRPPVVTVMGHVDHGKTSLLDALRATDVVAGEAGGITQHIGAYQVQMASGDKITFIDTPGHEAFTAMRSRGAKVTDIVVLVVAADDGIMPQTVEAIRHARAAEVPVVVAINKMDKPGADPSRVRQELLNHELVVEEMGGDVLTVEVSAKQRLNLEKLEEAILLQAEIQDLKANPAREAEGTVIEAKMEKGRGSVATVLIRRGTLKVGDIFVAGTEWGRVRAMIDDRGNRIEEAGPAYPVEILGFQGTPQAGDDFVVVDDEAKAREVAGYRQRKEREALAVKSARGTMEQMFAKIKAGEAKELPVVIKADVQGSVEAIVGTLEKMGTEAVKVRVLHSAVGGINESDITLAKASEAVVIGFNVRANPQARELSRRDGVEIRYYSIIYDVAEDIKRALTGLLEPTFRERFIGYAEIRQVYNITRVGKVAGCMVTEGIIKRGCKVRLLRDNVVIHEGDLGQLKRFKDDVREVREGFECGMSFANYDDIKEGDLIECFEMEEIAAEL
ncbi:translation initiation factor IF-2 [Caenispirillum salinarum]|uniref:translation initiation factor IF-2 n=1 Tax=Caenispirillum salinarum TaxID=859058 RepID=UPI00384F1F57